MEKTFNLQKLAVKLAPSGTALLISNVKLYTGSFGFVLLQAFVAKTQQARGTPLCTVHRTVVDERRIRRNFNKECFNMLYIGNSDQEAGTYMVFECPMPRQFTEIAGDLEIVFNYTEMENGKAFARLASNIYRTTVSDGGTSSGEIQVDLKAQEIAQINANTIAIEQLTDSVDELLQSPCNADANKVGTARVELATDGRLKFIELKGETGETGNTGLTPNITAEVVGLPAGSTPTVDRSGAPEKPVLTFGLPKGDKGNTGEPFSISKVYSSIAAMQAGYATDNVPIGGFVVIDTGNPEDADNATLYIKGNTQYDFIVDLSGMQGFTGVGISQIVFDSKEPSGSNKYKVVLTNNEVYYFTAPVGPIGETGRAATITVGTTTTLPAGSNATISERGTPQERILDFGVPKGTDGTGAGNTTVYVGGAVAETVHFSSNPQTQINDKIGKAAQSPKPVGQAVPVGIDTSGKLWVPAALELVQIPYDGQYSVSSDITDFGQHWAGIYSVAAYDFSGAYPQDTVRLTVEGGGSPITIDCMQADIKAHYGYVGGSGITARIDYVTAQVSTDGETETVTGYISTTAYYPATSDIKVGNTGNYTQLTKQIVTAAVNQNRRIK